MKKRTYKQTLALVSRIEKKLKEHDTGTIVSISSDSNTFDLEFVDNKGKTYAYKTVQVVAPPLHQEEGWDTDSSGYPWVNELKKVLGVETTGTLEWIKAVGNFRQLVGFIRILEIKTRDKAVSAERGRLNKIISLWHARGSHDFVGLVQEIQNALQKGQRV